MFRALSAHLQEDTVAYMQHILLSLCTRIRGDLSVHSSCLLTDHQEVSWRVTVTYAACIQLYPPKDEHSRLETCTGKQYFMNK